MKKAFILISLILGLISCERQELPYERAFKKAVIRSSQIEPIVESVAIEKTYDSTLLYRYWNDRLKIEKNRIKDDTYSNLIKAKGDYDKAVKTLSKGTADRVYLHYVQQYQQEYDNIRNDVYKSKYLEIYNERIKYPSTFEQITIKYKLSETGPLLIGRYRSDIFMGDTSFYELKAEQTLKDYINGK